MKTRHHGNGRLRPQGKGWWTTETGPIAGILFISISAVFGHPFLESSSSIFTWPLPASASAVAKPTLVHHADVSAEVDSMQAANHGQENDQNDEWTRRRLRNAAIPSAGALDAYSSTADMRHPAVMTSAGSRMLKGNEGKREDGVTLEDDWDDSADDLETDEVREAPHSVSASQRGLQGSSTTTMVTETEFAELPATSGATGSTPTVSYGAAGSYYRLLNGITSQISGYWYRNKVKLLNIDTPPGTDWISRSATYTGDCTPMSWKTYFEFSASSVNQRGDGFVFVISDRAYVGQNAGASHGLTGGADAAGRLTLAVRFDFTQNAFDLNNNNVGVIVLGDSTLAFPAVQADMAGINMVDGTSTHVWITYDARTRILSVKGSKSATEPTTSPPQLTVERLDLCNIFKKSSAIASDGLNLGFIAANGASTAGLTLFKWKLDISWPSSSSTIPITTAASVGFTPQAALIDTFPNGKDITPDMIVLPAKGMAKYNPTDKSLTVSDATAGTDGAGSVFFNTPIRPFYLVADNVLQMRSWTASFVHRTVFGNTAGEGFTFTLATSTDLLGGCCGNLGYRSEASTQPGAAFAIEFDHYAGQFNDPAYRHVGINIGNSMSSIAFAGFSSTPNNLGADKVYFRTWVDYDGMKELISVSTVQGTTDASSVLTATKPAVYLYYGLDMVDVAVKAIGVANVNPTTAWYAGFTAGKGGDYSTISISDFSFLFTA